MSCRKVETTSAPNAAEEALGDLLALDVLTTGAEAKVKAQGEGSEQDARVGVGHAVAMAGATPVTPKMTKARNAKPTIHRSTTGNIAWKAQEKNLWYLRRTFPVHSFLNLPYLRFICILVNQDLQLAGISADLPYLCH